MAAPHNPERYGDLWDPRQLSVMELEIHAVAAYVTVSGGWAWHFLTPKGHTEYTHAHDHKDADLFVKPIIFAPLVSVLKQERGFERARTRFDTRVDSRDFYRFVKYVEEGDAPPVKVIFDVFVAEVPCVMAQEVRVVEPKYLLSLYGVKHSSDECFSVQIAKRLIAEMLSVNQHESMANYEAWIARK